MAFDTLQDVLRNLGALDTDVVLAKHASRDKFFVLKDLAQLYDGVQIRIQNVPFFLSLLSLRVTCVRASSLRVAGVLCLSFDVIPVLLLLFLCCASLHMCMFVSFRVLCVSEDCLLCLSSRVLFLCHFLEIARCL